MPARTVDDRDGKQVEDIAPLLPSIELNEIVGPHDPDEIDRREKAHDRLKRIGGEARPEAGLQSRHMDARVVLERYGGLHPLLQRGEFGLVLERIARRHQPPHGVEPEPPQGDEAGVAMALMRRIERAAEQSDAQPRRRR